MHDTRAVKAGGILPQRHAIDAEKPLQERRVRSRHIPDGMNTVILQLPRGGRAAIQKLGTVERPNLFPEIFRPPSFIMPGADRRLSFQIL